MELPEGSINKKNKHNHRFKMTNSIRISKTVALWMISLGRRLVSEAHGSAWAPGSEDRLSDIYDIADTNGFMDQIPTENMEVFQWVDALLMFVRTLTAIAANEIGEENIPPEFIDLVDTIFEEDGSTDL